VPVDRRALLEDLQSQLKDAFDTAMPRDKAVLAKEIRAVTAELESLPTGEVSSVDDLARKRAARRAEAAG
jgi:hypothetical protein